MYRNFVSFAYIVFIASTAFGLTHSEPRSYTGAECGIKGYETSARSACGVEHYKSDRGEACGAERYNSRADLSCNGSDAGGRTIKPVATEDNYGVRISWNNVTQSTVQGDEDLRTLLAPAYKRWIDFGGQKDGGTWIKDTKYWTCTLKADHNQQFSFATVTCIAKQYLATCEKSDFGVALWAYCENKAFGILSYNTCEDSTKPIYNTCQIRKTNAEVESYVTSVSNDIDYNAQLYANNLGAFLARIQDKIQMACLIDTYQDKPQFSPIIGDLIDKYEANFGEIYEPGTYGDQCTSAVPPAPMDVAFKDLKCSALTSDDVKNGVKNSIDAAQKRFYQNCFAQKSYELPKSWFQFQLAEINTLLDDVAAKNSESTKQLLINLTNDLKAANVVDGKGN